MVRVARNDAAPYIRKLTIKIRFADFRQTSVECVAGAIDPALFTGLLEMGFARGAQPVRLLGAGVRLEEETPVNQLGLFVANDDAHFTVATEAEQPENSPLQRATVPPR